MSICPQPVAAISHLKLIDYFQYAQIKLAIATLTSTISTALKQSIPNISFSSVKAGRLSSFIGFKVTAHFEIKNIKFIFDSKSLSVKEAFNPKKIIFQMQFCSWDISIESLTGSKQTSWRCYFKCVFPETNFNTTCGYLKSYNSNSVFPIVTN